MALDFKEAVGEDDAAKEEFCEVQKNQVPKLAFNKTNLISEPGLILGSQAVKDVIVLRCFFLENFDVA